jgi:hypothetical protein
MKKSKLFLLGILITGMAFGLVLAGCDTGDDGPTAEELADQLAEDINALREGSATVTGTTVTLTGGLSLESQFTVPAGVTLDLTGDGELGLLDATLTVNGMVKAGSNKVRMRSAASWGTINGSGTIQLKGKGNFVNIGRSDNVANKTLTLDGVTLVGVVDNSDPLVRVSEGGEFVLKSGAITGNTRNGGGAGVVVNNRGTFTMEGGKISGNAAKGEGGILGGGVQVNEGAVFTMTGGEISGNTATPTNGDGQGGGVNVSKGTFTMSGGKISGNTAEGGNYAGGGGMRIGSGGTFTMTGGEISGNSAAANGGSSGSSGGGVKITGEGTTFTMKAGAISGNTARNGGGVVVEAEAAFIMEGGTIYGKAGSLPAGSDANLANIAQIDVGDAALNVNSNGTAKWGTGGTYTKSGVSQTGGTDIGATDDTLIAIPAQ